MARMILYSLLTISYYDLIITKKEEVNPNELLFRNELDGIEEEIVIEEENVVAPARGQIQRLMEYYPYIVALLNDTKEFLCSGVILNNRTVLTASNCINSRLKYICMGLAIIDPKHLNENALKLIVETELFGSVTDKFYNKVGVVYSETSDLDTYFGFVDINRNVDFHKQIHSVSVLGYGLYVNVAVYAIQSKAMNRKACSDIKFDSGSICGYFGTNKQIFVEDSFGNGGVIMDSEEVVALTGHKCGVFPAAFDYSMRQYRNITCEVCSPIRHLNLTREEETYEILLIDDKMPYLFSNALQICLNKLHKNIFILVYATLDILINLD